MKKILLTLVACGLAFGAAAKRSLLLIESYDRANPWASEYRRGIEDAVRGEYDLTSFNLNSKQVDQAQMPMQTNLAWKRFREVSPPLVFLGDDEAVKYLSPRLENTTTPVIYLGVSSDPNYYVASSTKTMTGFVERPLLKQSIRNIRQILGARANKVLVLMDNSAQAKAMVRDAGRSNLSIGGVRVKLHRAKDWEEWQRQVKGLKRNGYDAVVVALSDNLTNMYGNKINYSRVLSWTSSQTPVPPFTFWSHGIGKNRTIGGLVLDGYEQGKSAAKLALDILDGRTKIDTTPKVDKKGQFIFSRMQLAKWKIALPESIKKNTKFIE